MTISSVCSSQYSRRTKGAPGRILFIQGVQVPVLVQFARVLVPGTEAVQVPVPVEMDRLLTTPNFTSSSNFVYWTTSMTLRYLYRDVHKNLPCCRTTVCNNRTRTPQQKVPTLHATVRSIGNIHAPFTDTKCIWIIWIGMTESGRCQVLSTEKRFPF